MCRTKMPMYRQAGRKPPNTPETITKTMPSMQDR